ncbi:uncharacterized protein BT62DRAFT_717960 [Guyanagaster necrorhizus]|uniref:Methyltransferase domain-containing protein n=1 Tax=Guyanagaster necrorhizus TaxID=856835 RepID=A0A9P7VYL0_9AGAR|nr:uncharacterized protein BT62DRAFT_717960 [Guyanagaster necrorhizus MCA 3950]KAG7448619.1 hypothetical protein BT62DRAFT_717960 [Guyanagaster necrorhizus MCA 3950]
MSSLRPLDPSLYVLADDEVVFIKSQTGIDDDEELKRHILAIQEEAYKLEPYPCIRRFGFAKWNISRQPCYHQFLNLGQMRKGTIYVDIGCCLGSDARKAVSDGYPIDQVIASDLRPEFWDLGHKLFKSTPETFPARFISADIFQLKYLASEAVRAPPIDLSKVQLLSELRGSVSAIHASALFHLFDEGRQFELAKIMASLLSSAPGSMIFGSHGSQPEKGIRTEIASNKGWSSNMFCHSPESWRSLWDGGVFPKDAIRVDVSLLETERPDMVAIKMDSSVKTYLLVWCITVL